MGQTVYSADGEEIGEVQDVVLRQGGSAAEVVVGVGGFLGIGERDIAIPMDQVRMQDDRLTTSMTKDAMGGMQGYEASGYSSWDRAREIGQ